MMWPYDAPHRGASTPQKPFGTWTPAMAAGRCQANHTPTRPAATGCGGAARMLGGRTNHWGRISLRMGPYDFKPYSRDGKGFDWPITYDDLTPYYDKTEELIGVFGSAEGLENTPDGKFQPPPKPRCYELVIQKRLPTSSESPALPRASPSSRSRSTGVPPAITAPSAGGAAPPLPIFPRPPCCCRPRSPPAISKSAATPWREKF